MSHIRVRICRVDELEQMTEVAAFELDDVASVRLEAAHTLDDLEASTHRIGNAILSRVLQAQWELIDAQLTEQDVQAMAPTTIQRDGREPIKVATRFELVELSRQLCTQPERQVHTMPGKAVLPAHQGMLITRGLQEWACLLSQDLSFATAARLLSWQTQEAHILSATTLRKLVREHGQIIRDAEQAETVTLAQPRETSRTQPLVPHQPSRRRLGWPVELKAAVEAALAADQVCPPEGVSWADWARVRAVRQAEAERTVAQWRHLGPELAPQEVLVTVDEVLTRQATPVWSK